MKGEDRSDDISIGVIGMGYVGLPLASLLAKQNRVTGYEYNREKVTRLKSGDPCIVEPGIDDLFRSSLNSGNLTISDNPDDIKPSNVKIITVGTPFDEEKEEVDFSQLKGALSALQGRIQRGNVIILKSTVPPGTTTGMVREFVDAENLRVPEDVGLVFSPERIVEGQAVRDFSTLPKIIGATDPRSYGIAERVIGSLGGTVIKVSSPTAAELVKMIDNYARYVFLGLTNEIALMSEMLDVDALEVIGAAKRDYPRNAGILRPGPGVGGSCLNKDPFILKFAMEQKSLELKMVESASIINHGMVEHVADLTAKYYPGHGKITVAGASFKGDTDDTRFSTALDLFRMLRSRGYYTVLTDPFVSSGTLAITHDIYDAARGSSTLVIMTDHSEYRNVDLLKLAGVMDHNPVIIDTRAILGREEAIKSGFIYHGLGRL